MSRKRVTPLDTFIEENEISQTELARRSGYTRRHIFHVRKGTANPTLDCMVAITDALAEMVARDVTVEEVFELKRRRKAS